MSIKLEDGRKLKPLAWKKHSDTYYAATCSFGVWEIADTYKRGRWDVYFASDYIGRSLRTEQEAKALCEADYARRVDELYEEIE